MSNLTFKQVSDTNLFRCENYFKHPLKSWDGAKWGVAMAGEAGEVCNAIKKLNRLEDNINQNYNRPVNKETALLEIKKEIGDAYCYLDLLAQYYEFEIEDCIKYAFNTVSEREGFQIKL